MRTILKLALLNTSSGPLRPPPFLSFTQVPPLKPTPSFPLQAPAHHKRGHPPGTASALGALLLAAAPRGLPGGQLNLTHTLTLNLICMHVS